MANEHGSVMVDTPGSYRAALLLAALGAPFAGSLAMVIAYAAYSSDVGGDFPPPPFPGAPHYSALFTGVLIALATWALLALVIRPFTRADRAHAVFYDQLCSRYVQLRTRLDGLRARDGTPDYLLAHAQAMVIGDELGVDDHGQPCRPAPAGLSWLLLTRYNDLFGRVHRAEQALIAIERREAVIDGAIRDASRLDGSKIPGRDGLLARLREAVGQIDPAALRYLDAGSKATNGTDLAADGGDAASLAESVGQVYAHLDALHHALGAIPAPERHSDGRWTADLRRLRTSADWLRAQDEELRAFHTSLDAKLNQLREHLDQAKQAVAGLRSDVGEAPAPGVGAQLREAAVDLAALDAEVEGACKRLAGEAQPRTILRAVRTTINTYRCDIQWGGLLRVRNQLLWLTGLTGLVGYALLSLAILQAAKLDAIIAALAFYLVGAGVGLFSQLYRMWQREEASEDYGVVMARSVARLPLSGLAAVGGVVVTAMIPALLSGVIQAPTPTVQGSGSSRVSAPLVAVADTLIVSATTSATSDDAGDQPIPVPQLSAIFDLGAFPLGLVFAAVFGLAPDLLLRKLNSLVVEYKDNLKTSEVGEEVEISSAADRSL